MAILKNSMVVAGWTMASRSLGFFRDLLIANKLGAGVASDAFFVALMLPNLLRRLLGEGALNVAFVPIFAKHKAANEEAALAFASAVLRWLGLVLLVITVVGVVLMPLLVTVMVPGFADDVAKFELTVLLGRVTFPYLMLICLAAILGAVCNTYGKFAAYALVPTFLNVSLIGGLLLAQPLGVAPALLAAVAVPVGGVLQVGFMIWAARRCGLVLRVRGSLRHPDIKTLLQRMGPAALGVGVLQLSLIIDNAVASYVGDGAVTLIQLANRFYQLPLSLIGIAVATVLLPHLSLLLGKGDKAAATTSFTGALVACMTLAVGSMVGLFVLADEAMITLLAHGEMTTLGATQVAWAMMGFVVGLPGYILVKITAPAFFANHDTASPVKASAVSLLVNLVVNVAVVWWLLKIGRQDVAHVGIALATAVGGYVNAGMQWYWLTKKKVLDIDMVLIRRDALKMLAVGAVMALVLVGAKLLVPFDPAWGTVLQVLWLAVVGGVGGVAFVAAVQVSGLIDLRVLVAPVLRKLRTATGRKKA